MVYGHNDVTWLCHVLGLKALSCRFLGAWLAGDIEGFTGRSSSPIRRRLSKSLGRLVGSLPWVEFSETSTGAAIFVTTPDWHSWFKPQMALTQMTGKISLRHKIITKHHAFLIELSRE